MLAAYKNAVGSISTSRLNVTWAMVSPDADGPRRPQNGAAARGSGPVSRDIPVSDPVVIGRLLPRDPLAFLLGRQVDAHNILSRPARASLMLRPVDSHPPTVARCPESSAGRSTDTPGRTSTCKFTCKITRSRISVAEAFPLNAEAHVLEGPELLVRRSILDAHLNLGCTPRRPPRFRRVNIVHQVDLECIAPRLPPIRQSNTRKAPARVPVDYDYGASPHLTRIRSVTSSSLARSMTSRRYG